MPIPTKNAVILHKIPSNSWVKVEKVDGLPVEIERLSAVGIYNGAVVRVSRGGITSIVELQDGSRFCLRTSPTLKIFCVQTNDE